MKSVSLGEIAQLGSGGTPKRSVAEYFGPGTPWMSIADLNDGTVYEAKESLTESGLANSSAKVVPPGTILLAMYGSIGKLAIAGVSLCTSQAIAFIRPDPTKVDREYLFHYLRAQRPQLQALGRGGTQMNISQGDLKKWMVPLPPLDEQRRIAAILDQADQMREAASRAQENVNLAEATVTRQFFAAQAVADRLPLESVSEKVVVGHVGPTTEYFTQDGVPFLRTGNIGAGQVLSDDIAEVTPEFHARLKKSQLKTGDVLISRVISDRVRTAILPPELDGANCANIIVVRPSQSLLAEVITGYLNLPETQYELLGRKVGSAQSVVNTGVLKSLLVPVPPVEAQRAFCEVRHRMHRLRTQIADSERTLLELFASLQARAFVGQL